MVFFTWIPNSFKNQSYSNGLILQYFLVEDLVRPNL